MVDEYSRYDVQYSGMKESVSWTLWHIKKLTILRTSEDFFNESRPFCGHTNMDMAGTLPSPQAFYLREIRFYAPVDFYLEKFPRLELVIGTRIYGNWSLRPLLTFPSFNKVPLKLFSIFVRPDFPWDSRIELSKPLFIAPQINFRVLLLWDSILRDPINIEIHLKGDLIRPIM